MKIGLFEEKIDKNIKECKGLVFKGYHSTFYDNLTKKIEHREGIRLLKRRSCPGCEKCFFFLDDMNDMILIDGLNFPEDGIENGKLYTIIVTNVGRDWESGLVDEWDFSIIEIKDKKEE